MAVYCILLKDGIATKKSKPLMPKGKSQQIQSLQGSLWILEIDQFDGKRFLNPKEDMSKLTVKLKGLDDDNVTFVSQASDVAKLDEYQFSLLVAISTCADRYKVFQDKPWMEEAHKIEVNSVVLVVSCEGVPEKAPAIVRFKGKLDNMKGVWFGVELSDEYKGKGTTDGTFRKKQYFTCEMDNGLFLPINKVRRSQNTSLFKRSKNHNQFPVEHQETLEVSPSEPPPELSIGERVVWVDDNGEPQLALVHWIGCLPDAPIKEWTVGVEFDSRIGTGTGKYKDTQLFKARNGHASLIPILGLMKAEEYYGSRENIPNFEKHEKYKFPSSKVDSLSYCDTTTHGNKNVKSDQQQQRPVLDENYYRESYKTNRPPTYAQAAQPEASHHQRVLKDLSPRVPVQIHQNFGGEYDLLDTNKIPLDPIYASVSEVKNETIHTGHPVAGVHMEDIYTLPKKGNHKAEVTVHKNTTPQLIQQRTIKVTNFPERQGSLDKQLVIKSHNFSSTQNITSPSSSASTPNEISKKIATSVISQSANCVYPENLSVYSPTSQSPGASKAMNIPVMHEETLHERSATNSSASRQDSNSSSNSHKFITQTLTAEEISKISDFGLGSVVEVIGNPENCKYGVIRWMGYIPEKSKYIVGLEMEEESPACTDGTFGGQRYFECPSKKAFFVYLSKLRKDSRFEESDKYLNRTNSLAFGSLECPDVKEDIPPMDECTSVDTIVGKNKGIQGHHNSCYLDATLFSMFAFTQTFDSLMFREKDIDDIEQYEDVQVVLKDGIVNPLRKNFYVRADKVLKLRTLLDKLSSVQGLMSEEKDPEEFFTSLLQQILKAQPLLKFSNGQTSYLYQLFVEKDEKIMLPTTGQLLELSFIQADMKLSEPPNCLILQMPRFGKDYKMYRKIVPSLKLDITDILEHGPRECHLCGQLATHECRDCFQLTTFELGLFKTAFCSSCLQKFHQHRTRVSHKPKLIQPNKDYERFLQEQQQRGISLSDTPMPREIMELFAVICIETSHYVAFVKCGSTDTAPWVLFDSMADRMGAQNGYNIPEVKKCDFLPDILLDDDLLIHATQDKSDKEIGDLKRLLCDGYICMYRSKDLNMYA